MSTAKSVVEEVRVALPGVGFTTRVLRSGAGVGVPALFLHGNPDNAGEWRSVLGELGEGFAGFAPDLPGFGDCDEPPVSFEFSSQHHLAFLDELLAQLHIAEPFVLVVHDIGGPVGLAWAAKHLDRIAGVVVTNTVVFEDFAWFSTAQGWARTDALGRAQAAAGMWIMGLAGGHLFRRVFGAASPELPPEDLARMTHEFARHGKAKRSTLRFFRQMLGPGFFDGMDAAVRTLIDHVPVRVVWGDGDPYIPLRYADVFRGAECEIVPQGGHWIPISSATRVAAAVRAVAGHRAGG